jgi:hypothetical protein
MRAGTYYETRNTKQIREAGPAGGRLPAVSPARRRGREPPQDLGVHRVRGVELHPVAGLGKVPHAQPRRPLLQPFGEPLAERRIAVAPEHERGGRDRARPALALGEAPAQPAPRHAPAERAVVVERRGEGAGLRDRVAVALEVGRRERAGPQHRPPERREQRPEAAVAAEQPTRGARGAGRRRRRASAPPARRAQLAREGGRVRRVEDHEPLDERGVALGDVPRDHPAPVVPHERGDARLAERAHERHHVARERRAGRRRPTRRGLLERL